MFRSFLCMLVKGPIALSVVQFYKIFNCEMSLPAFHFRFGIVNDRDWPTLNK